jgi:hypothetical protein
MKHITLKQAVLCAMMLLGAVAVNATEEEAWLQSGSLTERTENWAKSGSLKATQASEDTTPPGEPWGVPVGNGIWYILAATCVYALYKKRNQSIILLR